MIRSIKAIVRCSIPGCSLKPGDAVLVSSLAFQDGFGSRFPATLESDPEPLFWLERKYLLPMSEYLAWRPTTDFWELMYKPALKGKDPDRFIKDARTEILGPLGFRFESEGELIHYLRFRGLNPKLFMKVHIQPT